MLYPEVVLNVEVFQAVTTECFSGLWDILKSIFLLSNHLRVKHGGYVPPTLTLESYFICQKSGFIHCIPLGSLEKSPIISLNSINRQVVPV